MRVYCHLDNGRLRQASESEKKQIRGGGTLYGREEADIWGDRVQRQVRQLCRNGKKKVKRHT